MSEILPAPHDFPWIFSGLDAVEGDPRIGTTRMFKSNTLFVVGAGASSEIGLPVGATLKTDIAAKLRLAQDDFGRPQQGDLDILRAIQMHAAQTAADARSAASPYWNAAQRLSEAMPLALSIDNYIDAHRGDSAVELCGKLGIVKSIVEAERGSRIYVDESRDIVFSAANLVGTWYQSFVQLLTEGVAKQDVAQIFENVSFITFNYDRCIEHCLEQSLQVYYGLSPTEAQAIVQRLRIFHPYGQVGRLPWQNSSAPAIRYGGGDHGGQLLALASQIKTFTERVEEGDELAAMRKLVAEAEIIVFLGFAYAEQNLSLLTPGTETKARQIYGTARGISESDLEHIQHRLGGGLLGRGSMVPGSGSFLQLRMHMRQDKSCADIFSEYWRSFSS